MKLVALLSTYLEGPIAAGAIRSAFRCEPDAVIVFEGPAGDPLDADVPETDFGRFVTPHAEQIHLKRGKWMTDATKRNAMVRYAVGHYWRGTEPLWGVWIDGDEVLMNGEWLRDKLQYLEWRGEQEGTAYAGMPIRILEMGGTTAWAMARVIRLDLISKYVASNSLILLKGNREPIGRGHFPESALEWWKPRSAAAKEDQMCLMPPFDRPLDPYLVHRSAWRHPLRVGLRLHEQEAEELKRLGVL